MNDGYRELVLTLQNIMYSDSELKYIAKERIIILFIIERICEENLTEEISEEVTYRHCILIRKSTVDYLEGLEYNLFRQFESSQDSAYYERPLLRKSGDAYKTYKFVTMMDYSLDIYCYVMPPSSRRRYPTVSLTIFVRNRSNLHNSSESTGDNPPANNQNCLEYFPDVSRLVSNGSRSSFGSIWGSRSRLPTALVEPISKKISYEELSSTDLEWGIEPGGIFVKLPTLSSTRSRSGSSSGGSIPDASEDEMRASPNLMVVDNLESSIPGLSDEGTVARRTCSSRISDEDTVARRSGSPIMSDEDTIARRTCSSRMSDEDTVARRTCSSRMSDEDTVARRTCSSRMSDEDTVARRTGKPGMSGSEEPCENRSPLHQTENGLNSAPSHHSFDGGIFSQNETTTTNEYISVAQIQDKSGVTEVYDPNEDLPLDNSQSDTDEHYLFRAGVNGVPSIEIIERRVAFNSFLGQNRITQSLQYPDVDHEQLREAPKNRLNPNNHGLLPPMYVPLVWSQKCEDLQYLLSLKLTQPYSYIQEYNRIRKSNFSMLDCLRKRERSGALNQTKVMEVIAEPHYNIYPPADEEDIRKLLENNQDEEMDLDGYLMVGLKTRRSFHSYPLNSS